MDLEWELIGPYLPISRYGPYPSGCGSSSRGDPAVQDGWAVAGDAAGVRHLVDRFKLLWAVP